MEYFFLGLLGFRRFFFVFVQRVVAQVGIKNKRKMSDCDSESIHSESERSSDSDSEGSLADFVVDDEDEEVVEACTCRAEICGSNVINRKRRRTPVDHEESSNDEGDSDDSSSDYVPSEADVSSSDGSECSDDGSDAD